MATIIDALIGPLGAVAAVVAAIVAAWVRGRHSGAQEAESDAIQQDTERARQLRDAADAARADADDRPAIERLRSGGHLRD